MQLFFNPTLNEQHSDIVFDREESRHIVKVLRKSMGDKIFVTNGVGLLFETEIAVSSDTRCTVRVVGITKAEPRPYRLHLAVAPTKMNDRFEWFLEKATEIGIDDITPLLCDRSERRTINETRFTKIIHSAMKQSGTLFEPKLHPLTSFAAFVKSAAAAQKFVAHCSDTYRDLLRDKIVPKSDSLMLIGPEGDFSPHEISMALENDYLPVSLGHSRLRTETAAVVAAHSAAYINA